MSELAGYKYLQPSTNHEGEYRITTDGSHTYVERNQGKDKLGQVTWVEQTDMDVREEVLDRILVDWFFDRKNTLGPATDTGRQSQLRILFGNLLIKLNKQKANEQTYLMTLLDAIGMASQDDPVSITFRNEQDSVPISFKVP